MAADTQASQKAVHDLPTGKPRVALEQTLANTLFDERTSLHRLLSQVGWESHVAFTRQLGALGEAVPAITGVTVSWDSGDILGLTINGKNFAPGARLVIDGSSRGIVLHGSTTILRVSVHTFDMYDHMMSRIGVVNPDGTAAQFAYSGNWDSTANQDQGIIMAPLARHSGELLSRGGPLSQETVTTLQHRDPDQVAHLGRGTCMEGIASGWRSLPV